MEYRLSREEPVQPSRGARRLKRKKTSKTGVLSPDRVNKKDDDSRVLTVDPPHSPVLKPRRQMSRASVEMETQEVTADFSGRPDTPDEDKLTYQEELVVPTEDYGWRPGSLIPSRVTIGVFG